MFGFVVLTLTVLTDEVVGTNAAARGSNMVRREETDERVAVSAAGNLAKSRLHLHQSSKRRPSNLAQSVESWHSTKSPAQHEEEADIPLDIEEVASEKLDNTAEIDKLKDEVATLKMRLGQESARSEVGELTNNRLKEGDKRRVGRQRESEDGSKVQAIEARRMHAHASDILNTDEEERDEGGHEGEKHAKTAIDSRHRKRALPTFKKRHHSHHDENFKFSDGIDEDGAHSDADSAATGKDNEWATHEESPLHRFLHSWRSRHRHKASGKVRHRIREAAIGDARSYDQPHDGAFDSNTIRDVGKRVSTISGGRDTSSSDVGEVGSTEFRRRNKQEPLQNKANQMSADAKRQIAEKLIIASRNSVRANADANASANSTTTIGNAATPVSSLRVKPPIEFEPWLGTTNPPQSDPFGQTPYIQGPQMLTKVSEVDDTAKVSEVDDIDTTTTPVRPGDEAVGDHLSQPLQALEEAAAPDHDVDDLAENDGTNQYGLSYPPRNRPQLEQYLRIAREMDRVELMGGISEQGARNAFKNLYANWTHTDWNARERYLSGMRIRIVGQQIFYSPEPPELRQLAISQPSAFQHMFSIVAAHVLSFLTGTMAKFKLPNADFTVAFGDFCVGTTRLFHDAWGTKRRADVDAAEAPAAPGAAKSQADDAPELEGAPNSEFTEAFQVPVFQWTNTQSGRKACNVITTSTYDWNWWGSNFTQGSSWRLDHQPPAWKDRLSKIVWRGSLLSQESIRSRALRVGLRHPELLDIKIVKALDCEKYVADLVGFSDHNAMSDCQAAVSNFTSMEQQQKYKYILEMDGGGTTFRFKNLLLGGFLVFKVDADTTQFWSDSLQPFVHYIPISKENFEQDLVRKLRWAMEHDTDCEHIAANARRFALQYLRDTDAHWQQQAAISIYAGRQNFIPVGPEPGMMRFCCKDAANVNLKDGIKLTGLASECVDHDPVCAAAGLPNEMLYSIPKLPDMPRGATLQQLAQDSNVTKEFIHERRNVQTSSASNEGPAISLAGVE